MISTRKFALAFVVALLVSLVATGFLVSTSAGLIFNSVGGFTLKSNELAFQSLTAYPSINDTENGQRGLLVIEVANANADRLELQKTLDLTEFTDTNIGGKARIRLVNDNVGEIDEVILHVSVADAGKFNLSKFEIDENYVDENTQSPLGPNDPVEFIATGQSGSFSNAEFQVHYIAADKLYLPNFELDFEYDSDNDGTYEYT